MHRLAAITRSPAAARTFTAIERPYDEVSSGETRMTTNGPLIVQALSMFAAEVCNLFQHDCLHDPEQN